MKVRMLMTVTLSVSLLISCSHHQAAPSETSEPHTEYLGDPGTEITPSTLMCRTAAGALVSMDAKGNCPAHTTLCYPSNFVGPLPPNGEYCNKLPE